MPTPQLKPEGRISSGIDELDVVLGGGFVPGSTTLIVGDQQEDRTVLASQLAVGMALRLQDSKKGAVFFTPAPGSAMNVLMNRMICAFCEIAYPASHFEGNEKKVDTFLQRLELKLDVEFKELTLPDCLRGFSAGQEPAFLVYDYVGGLPSDDLEIRKRLVREVSQASTLAKKLYIPVIFFIQANRVQSQGVLRLDTRHVSECKTLYQYADTVVGISSVEDVNNIGMTSRQQCLYVSKNDHGKPNQAIWVEREFEFQRFGFQSLQGAKIEIAPPQVF